MSERTALLDGIDVNARRLGAADTVIIRADPQRMRERPFCRSAPEGLPARG